MHHVIYLRAIPMHDEKVSPQLGPSVDKTGSQNHSAAAKKNGRPEANL
jgi:hypothetical protein